MKNQLKEEHNTKKERCSNNKQINARSTSDAKQREALPIIDKYIQYSQYSTVSTVSIVSMSINTSLRKI